jgi:prephenate dehydratase/chorismate mutase/prephenate dehydratase
MNFDSDDAPLPQPAPAAQALLTRIRVAFQGELGAFSEDAVYQLWGADAEPLPMETFEDVMIAAETGAADYGLLPIESTLTGGVDHSYDLLNLHDGLRVVAEVVVEVHLALLALPGASLAQIRTLASHPLMLSQCTHFFARHKRIKPQPAWDTAGAAREVRQLEDPARAAAGTRRAAERFGLHVLQDRIEDRADCQMRFLAVGRDAAAVGDGAPARSAMQCVLPHNAGTLLSLLRPMADAGFNISNLATHPTREPWRYWFFLEFDHPGGDPRVQDALAAARRISAEFRYLGTYPRWPVPESGVHGMLPGIF